MVKLNEFLACGLIKNNELNNSLLLHFNGRKVSNDFFGFDNGFTFLVVYHPRTSVCLIRKRDGLSYVTLFAEKVSSIEEVKNAIEQL